MSNLQPSLPLPHESFLSALDEDIRALGGRKAVGIKLRPELANKPHEAHVWLNNCLNPERREKLSDEQIRLVIRWAREVNSFAAMFYWCDDTGFERPRAISPREEAHQILDRAAEIAAAGRAMATQLERLHESGVLRQVPASKASSG